MRKMHACHKGIVLSLCLLVSCSSRGAIKEEHGFLVDNPSTIKHKKVQSDSAYPTDVLLKPSSVFDLQDRNFEKNSRHHSKPKMQPLRFLKGTAARLEDSLRHHFFYSDDEKGKPSFVQLFTKRLGKQLSREINRSGGNAYTSANNSRLSDPSFSEFSDALIDSVLDTSKKVLVYSARNEENEYDWPDDLKDYFSTNYLLSAGAIAGGFAIASLLESDKVSGTLPLEDVQFVDDYLMHQGRIWFDSSYSNRVRETVRAGIREKRKKKDSIWSNLELGFEVKRLLSDRRRIQLEPTFNITDWMSLGVLFIANRSPDDGELRGNDIEDFGDHTRQLWALVFEIN